MPSKSVLESGNTDLIDLSLLVYDLVQEDTFGSIQDFLLALPSGIPTGGAWGTTWDASNESQVGHMQGKCPTHDTNALI